MPHVEVESDAIVLIQAVSGDDSTVRQMVYCLGRLNRFLYHTLILVFLSTALGLVILLRTH
jgi:hypothetical protein